MYRPNLFQFAKSELSQDAFICWCLAWGQQRENTQMRQFGLSFLNTMLEKHQCNVQDLERISIIDVKNQVDLIDVLVKFKMDDEEYELIIEDKTDTKMHSNQIKRYFDDRKKKSPDKEILGIYYKTGFIFEDEERKLEALRNENYPVKSLNKETILNYMSPYLALIHSDILHDYYNHIKGNFDREQETLRNIYSANLAKVEESLKTQMGQVEAIKSIFGNVKVNTGTSYGKPWAHFAFKTGNLNETLPDRLFYRIDKRGNGFYIALRQYRDIVKQRKQMDSAIEVGQLGREKVARLYVLRRIFDEIMAEIENDYPDRYIEPGKRTADNKGHKESDVGVFYFTEENTVERFEHFFATFHNRFCDGVDKAFGTERLKRI